ncbi:transmembrane adaptor Erv26 [Dichotomocladium elegans]|nr:transmembrane adaptor Erv26 [Dichotomocladium elegans]
MSFLHIVAYVAVVLGFCFVVLSLACGLYYLAELVEEYTVYTRKVIKTMTVTVVSIHVLLWIFDRLPFLHILFSILCHGVYTMNLQTFPFINLTSLPFIASCILVFADHFLWFQYFTTHYRPFMDIAAFFGVCIWLIPFTYFISLSANDNALPMTGSKKMERNAPKMKNATNMERMTCVLLHRNGGCDPFQSKEGPLSICIQHIWSQ